MSNRSVFPEAPEKPQEAPTGPLVALGWVVFLVAIACAPAVVWAVWRWAW